MPNALLVQELIALTTSRDRAETIVGDLLEEARRRGRIWFLSASAGVALAMFFRAFGDARGRTLRLLALGLLLWFVLYALLRIGGAALGLPSAVIDSADFAALPAGTQAYLAATLAISSFLAGLGLGGRTAQNGLNAVAPLAMFWAGAAIVLPVWDWLAGTASWYCTFFYLLGLPTLYLLPLTSGGLVAARRVRLAGAGADQ